MVLAAMVCWAAWAAADEHVVRQGESLPQLAEHYYGDTRLAAVLAAANGIAEVDEPLRAGERLRVPAPEHRAVGAHETWEDLARVYLGDARRAFVLIDANRAAQGSQPAGGAEIVIPIVVTYRLAYGDGLARLASHFYRRSDAARLIRRYNFITGGRVERGDVLLLPMAALHLTESGRLSLDGERQSRGDGSRRALQARVDEQIPTLEQLLQGGRYVETVAAASRLLASEENLSGNQVVSIRRALGTAQVALDREPLALETFRQALRHQPDMELNPITTSPKILRVMERARHSVNSR